MEHSILNSTKKILGIAADYTAFDVDIITHINSTFAILQQMGVGPDDGFFIEDDAPVWNDFIEDESGMNMVRSYMFLKVRLLFDPPPTSFAIAAAEKQIEEYEYRLSVNREWNLDPNDPLLLVLEEEV